jgi:glycosyltransferase involved in cell wall biosynthesis
MKIYFIIKALNNSGGTERVTAIIANELIRRNYEIGIVSIVGAGESPFFEINSNVKCYYAGKKKDNRIFPYKDLARYFFLRKLFKKEKPDIIVIVDAGRSFLKIPASKGYTTITWEHFNVNTNWHLLHPISRWIAAKFSDIIVTLTKQDAENYKKKFGAKNTLCIPNPVTIITDEKTKLTEKVVLAVGRYSYQKGFDLLLDAWNEVNNNGWKLRIVGSGGMESILKEIIDIYDLHDSVELLPITKNIVDHYKNASIYVMSSRHEGLPLVLIEAMSMGLPIISFDCETGPRDIIENNITGVLVPPLDVNQLATELETLIMDENKRNLFSSNALRLVKKFEISEIVDSWEKLFHDLKSDL